MGNYYTSRHCHRLISNGFILFFFKSSNSSDNPSRFFYRSLFSRVVFFLLLFLFFIKIPLLFFTFNCTCDIYSSTLSLEHFIFSFVLLSIDHRRIRSLCTLYILYALIYCFPFAYSMSWLVVNALSMRFILLKNTRVIVYILFVDFSSTMIFDQ